MFSPPDHAHNLSQSLSAILDDIGVNEVMVMKRRRMWMLNEAIMNLTVQLHSIPVNLSVSLFGSQTEGSTTEGLNSDLDLLYCNHDIRIIQDWSEWEQGVFQFLMVQDDTTSPGHCLLQSVRSDEPLPAQYVRSEHYSTDSRGRVLLKHTYSLPRVGGRRHGPADALYYNGAGELDQDFVFAVHCSSWPKEANPWLQRQNVSGWPTEDMKRYSTEQGCFVVPVGSITGMHQDTEWRISTSFAERCLMFSINTTQMRCYILMKMILKTFLKPKCGEAVSSFMCKNILFHCIANSAASSTWNECSLLTCLNQCLQALFNCILTEQCPHFIIPGNNLLAGKLTTQVKHQLVEVMCALNRNIEQSLLAVHIDDLGERLYVKSGHLSQVNLVHSYHIFTRIVDNYIASNLIIKTRHISQQDIHYLKTYVSKLCQIYSNGCPSYQVASSLYAPFLCSIIGSRQASADLQHSQVISPEALTWLTLGENSDISSGKLKLASALYCSGDLQRCESILAALREQLLHTTVVTRCFCYPHSKIVFEDYDQICTDNNEEVIKHNIAFCVACLPCEVNCIPNEMKYEMFRSTEEDRPYRGVGINWMDWLRGFINFWKNCAVVDSLPYLYFLQYKVYSQLQRPADQHRALHNLARTINTDPNLGHCETAWNLLGQCMEQENRNQNALICYINSLRAGGRNNAAKWLICCLLARLVNC